MSEQGKSADVQKMEGNKMTGSWVIIHDNGIPGQKGASDGYRTEEEAREAVNVLINSGAIVYDWYFTDYGADQ